MLGPGGAPLRRARKPISGFEFAGTADEALAQLDEAYATLVAGCAVSGPPAGEALRAGGGSVRRVPEAALVLHINREVIHHGAEIALLRDLYRAQAK